MNSCSQCKSGFEVTNEDLAFYAKIDVPPPTWCPPCREMRRMAWCNEGVLYNHQCGHCQKPIIAQLPRSNPRPVYCIQCWWSDDFDALKYGRNIDWNRSFFEQIHELELSVPHACVSTDTSNENSEYTHHAGQEKNCYMIFHATFAENCYYGYGVKKAKNCVDVHYCHESELCYECIDVKQCYNLGWCQDCTNCSDSYFLEDCIDCKNCFGCVGLRNKEYYINNEPYSKEDYQKFLSQFKIHTHSGLERLKQLAEGFFLSRPKKALRTIQCENVLGDHLTQVREGYYCFDMSDAEYARHCSQMQLGVKHCQDIYQYGVNAELCYEGAMIGTNAYNIKFCYLCLWQVANLEYCIDCYSSSNCFGCFGLKKNKYCILNKQYSKEDYFNLKSEIINRMRKTGEYGEFFPISMSQSTYNETSAQWWHPKTREEVLDKEWQWQDHLPGTYGKETLKEIPDSIHNLNESIIKEVLACQNCHKNYKIIEQEWTFYKQQDYPIPRECFDCRRMHRMKKRNPRIFWNRQCAQCKKSIQTTYSPNRPEIVYCEECYLKEVY